MSTETDHAQYYVSGRYAALCGFVPVFGLLFHHAVEMALKAVLRERMPHWSEAAAERHLKRTYGHNLLRLWQAVKPLAPEDGLDALDGTVAKLHEFEDIRYPSSARFTAAQLSQRPGEQILSDKEGAPCRSIAVSLDEVDELMERLWRVFGLEVEMLRWFGGETSFLVEGIYSQYNKRPLYASQVVLDYRRYDSEDYPWKW